ncbi:GGDEF domain-containing phosphodiesterase [Sphingomonas carotinifaciens]|uniref:EAL domain, c-di-GMP-specific phosphodiesterase class I (Or its enzymatically inactive variant) n=2 Tax=Sphingomonas TaxID=13687 RepID=A0A1G7IA90_9SPHN|nr:GGDEF domain-containing phosphodiesterase [Sphingomonas carotinifaciens]MBB4084951.1 EAL domain-containing protein (putative c-di-GMP-specific phosphodiesterase class I)/GGDEF domain-containing protein [Sphingomonas carotinifaciens]MWC44334.1 EAL domain-containing protein [Sphingomonas carotinifaciens]SDF09523.1 EAL domain, c-di-GMP-specific phosphodiesterase class I (or its enzymatically inactive variant) [Sphingomonas carotinifaciens]
MKQGTIHSREDVVATGIVLISFRPGPVPDSALVDAVVQTGRQPVVVQPEDASANRFAAGAARIALIDARDAPDIMLAAAERLAPGVEAVGGALLVLSAPALAMRASDAGATHHCSDIAALSAGLALAARHVERMAGDRRGARDAEMAGGVGGWIERAIGHGRPCVVVMVSLSRLDLVNAAHGRPAGTMLLRAIDSRIRAAAAEVFGEATITARLSGSNFVVAGMGGAGEAAAIAAALEGALARPVLAAGSPVLLGTRLGLARSEMGDDAAALLRRASEALAEAKASDGAVLRVAHPQGVAPLDVLGVDLHHAIERGEIDVLFQPQVEIATGRIVGVEALARWYHPTLGPLGAEPLFAAAERADLGIALSDHIQRISLARATRWPQALDGVRLSINLTAADIARAGFAEMFLKRVDASGFPRGRLTVEITETGMIENLDAAAALLAHLRGAGCRVAIDDFGTGYSSLAYLKALPLDYLKIDRAITQDIEGSPRDRVVVRGVIAMAQSLGLAVIAEGVETSAQLALLAAEGCNYYQGFLRAGALGEAQLVAIMESE